MELSNIFESEHEENWRIVFAQYTELYRQSPSIDVAMHFAFFCWYLLWQWDEISFPGETLSPYEKGTVDTRNGISKSKLLFDLDVTTKHLLTSPDNTPVKYLIVLCLMKKIYPYFFKEDTFSEVKRQKVVASISQKPLDDVGTKAIYNYLRTKNATNILPAERIAVRTIFPTNSLTNPILLGFLLKMCLSTAQPFTFFFIRKYLFTCTVQGGIKMDCPPVHIRIGRQNCSPILVSKPSAKE